MHRHRWLVGLLILVLFNIAGSFASLPQADITELFKKVKPSIVMILNYGKDGKTLKQGSGFFISGNGEVITNRHVLEDATKAELKTSEGKTYLISRIVAEDKEGDLIKVTSDIQPNKVIALKISASRPEEGERIIVIGNPLGLEMTISDGIVSAVREIPEYGRIIQITAPISPGSSGSPVINMKGEVIGIATSMNRDGQNLNFAVSSDRLARLVPGKLQALTEWNKVQPKGLSDSLKSYNYGIFLIQEEKYKDALSFFEEYAKSNPGDRRPIGMIGLCHSHLGRFQEAIEFFKQAIRFEPDSATLHALIGFAYYQLNRNQEAIESYKHAIRINPNDYESLTNLGQSYDRLNRYSEAIESFRQAIRINPNYADVYCALGLTYNRLNKFQEAIESFMQSIRLNPDYAPAHFSLGLAFDGLKRFEDAAESYKQAIRINPDYSEAHDFLGNTYLQRKRHEEAIESYKQAIRIKPDYAEAYIGLGMAYHGLKRFQEAIELIEQGLRIKPDNAEAWAFLATSYLLMNRTQEAIESLKNAVRIKPNYAEAHYLLGFSYNHINDRESALNEYAILKKLDKDQANKLFNVIYK